MPPDCSQPKPLLRADFWIGPPRVRRRGFVPPWCFSREAVDNSSLNELVGNIADSNRFNGYLDLTKGKGTAGTANNYLANECNNNEQAGSNPTGLCDPQP